MLSIFRSKLAKRLAVVVFAIVVVAFVITGVSGGGIGMGKTSLGGGDTIATVGNEKIGAEEVEQRARRTLANAAQQQPGLDMPAFVAGGGLQQTLDQLVAAEAMASFGHANGLVASRKMVDGDIAGVAAFNGPTGKFDQQTFQAALAAQHISEDALRTEIAGDIVRRQLLLPIAGAGRASTAIATAYAALVLERREGEVAIVPAAAMAGGKAPGDAEIAAFYNTHLAAFTTPERRMLRYALMGRDQVAAGAVPSEAEIAHAYAADAAMYAARETRTFEQAVLDSEAKARALAASVKGGTSFADAAKAAGFSASDIALGTKSQAELAALSSPAVAAAAFAAPEHGISAPAKSDFGWHVLHVVRIVNVPGKSLAEARPEIAATLAKQKQDAALAALVNGVEDRVSAGASFADIVKQRGLTVVTTPAIDAAGVPPGDPAAKPDPMLQPMLKDGFAAGADDPPVVETIAPGERYAVLDVAQVIKAAPMPLADVRDKVAAALLANQAMARARAVAEAIAAKVSAGKPLDEAVAAAGMTLPAPRKATAQRIQLGQQGAQIPAPVRALFTMAVGKARLVPAPNGAGWFVVALEKVTPGDAAKEPKLVDGMRGQLARSVGEEYVEAFAHAAEAQVGVTRNGSAIADLRAQLLGAAPPAAP